MPKRLIVPLDGSPVSHAALPIARGLAEFTGAGVTLLGVIDPPSGFVKLPPEGVRAGVRPRDFARLTDEHQRLEDYLEKVATTFPDTPVEVAVHLGKPAEEILELAEAQPERMIVMASHGRGGLGRALLGSVTTRVVQGATMPVFVVRATRDSKDEYGQHRFDKVMVPLDGSTIAEQALATVKRIFGATSELHLVRFIEPVAPGQAYAAESVAEYERAMREEGEAYLAEVADRLRSEGYAATWEVGAGPPAFEITQRAAKLGVSLVAMTTHGRTGFGRFLLGSVVERVLQETTQPMMVVRATQSDT